MHGEGFTGELIMDMSKEQKELVEKFKWSDEGEETTAPMEGWQDICQLQDCANVLLQTLLSKLEVQHWNGTSFIFPIRETIHPLLEETFSSWSCLESRLDVRSVICDTFSGMSNRHRTDISELVHKIIGEKVRIDSVLLLDNPECPIMEKNEIAEEDRATIQGNPESENFPLQIEIGYEVVHTELDTE